MALQGWITQGATRRAAGGQLVTCGLSAGVMPIGNCTAQGPIVASNTTAGSGAFVPGSATFELQLRQDGVVVGSKTVGVILVPNRPRISGVTLSADSVIIGGPGITYTTSLQSPGPTRSNVRLRIFLGQAATHTLVSDALVACGGALGDVPKGACTIRGGFTTPVLGTKDWVVITGFILLACIVIYITLDLSRPMRGFIRPDVGQERIEQLQKMF